MSLHVLRKIRELINNGAIVSGPKPLSSPSLGDNQDEFRSIVSQLWTTEKGVNSVGKGKLYAGMTLAEVINSLVINPDFKYTKPSEDTRLLFVHRNLGNIDFYWVNNRNSRTEELEASFRITGKAAEIWHAETAKTEQASYTIENGVTRVPLHLEANDAVFVVFRNRTSEKSRTVIIPQEKQVATIEGPWNIGFQEKREAPANATFETLTPWNENSDSGIKYFSGTGTYTKTIYAQAEWFKEGTQLWLDLGSVKNLAEVIINGKSLGIVWKTPFRVNVAEALKQGENTLEIKVTNLWVNRLIGDQQPGVGKKITYTTMPFYRPDSPLKTSGLLGPVQIVSLGQ
jgi:hypothetical protein